MWSRWTAFSGCLLVVEWYITQRIIDETDLGRLCGIREIHKDSTSVCSHCVSRLHGMVLSRQTQTPPPGVEIVPSE